MRILRSSLLVAAGLAASAQAAFAAPPVPVTFRVVAFGATVPGLPGQDIAPFKGSFDGGVSIFDIYCVDALNGVVPTGLSDFSAFTSRLDVSSGSVDLSKTRLGNLTPGNLDNWGAYVVAAYIANQIRTGVFTTQAQLGAASLAMWAVTSAFIVPFGANVIDLNWAYPTNAQILGQLNGTEPGTDPDYAWEAVILNAAANAFTITSTWNPADWVVISDANWSARESCGQPGGEKGVDLQNCIQEFVKYDVVPEPATMGLMAVGLVGLGLGTMRRRNRKK